MSLLGDASAFLDCEAEAKKQAKVLVAHTMKSQVRSLGLGWVHNSGRRLPYGGSKLWGNRGVRWYREGEKRHLIAGAMGGWMGWMQRGKYPRIMSMRDALLVNASMTLVRRAIDGIN